MKQQDHIDALRKDLKKQIKFLFNINALVIDDEADNASLNTLIHQDGEEESRIYNCIKKLQKTLPSHSLLQYTATPQAILLSSPGDDFRPRKVRFVEPGEGYIEIMNYLFQSPML